MNANSNEEDRLLQLYQYNLVESTKSSSTFPSYLIYLLQCRPSPTLSKMVLTRSNKAKTRPISQPSSIHHIEPDPTRFH